MSNTNAVCLWCKRPVHTVDATVLIDYERRIAELTALIRKMHAYIHECLPATCGEGCDCGISEIDAACEKVL